MSRIKTIAITRPQEDSEKLADELHSKGYKTFIVPMLRIEPVQESVQVLERMLREPPPQAICVTSKHAVRMLAQQQHGRSIPLCAVGSATAEEAKKAGFLHVMDAGGNADTLCRFIIGHFTPKQGSILYPRAVDVATDMTSGLQKAGFSVQEVVTYKAQFTEFFPKEYVNALNAGTIDAVMFFSKRSAENYVRIAQDNCLVIPHKKCTAIVQDSSMKMVLAPLECELRTNL